MEADLRGDEGENGDGRAFTIWQLVQEQGLLGLSRGQKLPLLRSVEGEEEDSGGCRCCCGEAVEAGGASVVFAPVVGSGGWPCC